MLAIKIGSIVPIQWHRLFCIILASRRTTTSPWLFYFYFLKAYAMLYICLRCGIIRQHKMRILFVWMKLNRLVIYTSAWNDAASIHYLQHVKCKLSTYIYIICCRSVVGRNVYDWQLLMVSKVQGHQTLYCVS